MTYKSAFFVFVFLLASTLVSSQKITKHDRKIIQQLEDSAKQQAINMWEKETWEERFIAADAFTKYLAKALKQPNSFWYPFDSLVGISKLYSPDTTFRIFTWEISKDLSEYKHRGAIQLRTADGSLKLFPLFDASDFSSTTTDSVRTRFNWIGAAYYKIILKEWNNKKYYTLLGFDNNEARSNKKWIEVLWFNQQGEPMFGGSFFQYKNEAIKPKLPVQRFYIEYKKDAHVRMNYDAELDKIVFEHLISESGDEQNKASLIPDGSFETFTWKSGKWVHNPILEAPKMSLGNFDPLLGNAPVDNSILDENGNIDQKKLNEQNKKNFLEAKKKSKKNKLSKIE